MILLHGISSGSGSWVHQLAHFQATARCIAWDAPGYGGSSQLDTATPIAAEYGEALKVLMAALEIESTMLVGHSLGALIATSFAREHSSRVAGMVLLDPAVGHATLPQDEANAKLEARIKQLQELGMSGLAITRSANLVSGNASDDARAHVRWNMELLSESGYTQAAGMLSRGDLIHDASGYPGRVVVASGSEDTITPESQCRRAAAAFPQGSYVSLPSLGHSTPVEDPASINLLLSEFQEVLSYA